MKAVILKEMTDKARDKLSRKCWMFSELVGGHPIWRTALFPKYRLASAAPSQWAKLRLC
jgi:hypothetical protein